MGVEELDQGDFLGAPPLFDFLFTRYCGANASVGLEPDELGGVVLLREAGQFLFFVLADANGQVASHAEVKNAGFAGHEVDVGSAVHDDGL